MKVLLVTGILLICVHIVASAALRRPKRDKGEEDIEIDDDKKDEIINGMNEGRRQLANKFQIANMKELSWDDDLEEKVPTWECGKNAQEELKKKIGDVKKIKTLDDFIKAIDRVADETIFGCFDPERTDMACVHKKCDGDKEFFNCKCGPGEGFSKSNIKEGEPGSECGGTNDDGLCKDGSSSLFSTGIIINTIAFYLLVSFVF